MEELRIKFAHIAADSIDQKAAPVIDEENHTINFVISTDSLDRDHEIVEQSAVAAAIPAFGKNPVCLVSHLHRSSDGSPPVAGAWMVETYKQFKHRSEMRLRFAVDTDKGLQYWKLYSQKFMQAVSIGFHVLDGHEEVKDGMRYYVITKIELYEISLCPVPANADALAKMKDIYQQKLPNTIGVASFDDLLSVNIDQRLQAIEDSLDEIKSIILPDSEGFADRLLGVDPDPEPSSGGDNITAEKIVGIVRNALNQSLSTSPEN